MDVEVRFFSATGITRSIAVEFARGLGLDTRYVNITVPETREKVTRCDADMEVYVVPIHGERIPGFIYRYLRGIQGDGRPLVALAVYGNMELGISLAQFDRLAAETGFNLIAAGAFVGEHTFCRFGSLRQAQGTTLRQAQGTTVRQAQGTRNNVGIDRSDQADLAEIYQFGQKVRLKVEQKPYTHISIPGPHIPMFIAGFPERGTRFIVKRPDVDIELCKKCGACVKNCPVGAIMSNDLEIDESKCIRCMACVQLCPVSARRSEFKVPAIDRVFGWLGKKRKSNLYFS